MLLKMQPPSGGCVLKLPQNYLQALEQLQPPSGGCVLKPMLRLLGSYSASSRLRAAVC